MKTIILGDGRCHEEEGQGCGTVAGGGERGHLAATLESVPRCFEGGSKIKTGKSFPAEGTASVKSLRWQQALSVQEGEMRSAWLRAGKGVEKEAGWESRSGACHVEALRSWMRTGDFIVSMLSGHWWVFELGSNMSASCLEKPLSVLCGVEAGRPGRRLSESGRGGGMDHPGRGEFGCHTSCGL